MTETISAFCDYTDNALSTHENIVRTKIAHYICSCTEYTYRTLVTAYSDSMLQYFSTEPNVFYVRRIFCKTLKVHPQFSWNLSTHLISINPGGTTWLSKSQTSTLESNFYYWNGLRVNKSPRLFQRLLYWTRNPCRWAAFKRTCSYGFERHNITRQPNTQLKKRVRLEQLHFNHMQMMPIKTNKQNLPGYLRILFFFSVASS